MSLIFLALTTLAIWVNLAALGLVASRWIGIAGLSRLMGIAVVVLGLFFVEHFHGIDVLRWLWPVTTAGATYVVYRGRTRLWERRGTELVFALGFVYGLLWRIGFSDLTLNAESITDMAFLANYMAGGTLPPVDHWMPPYRFDYYYALQHYAAALVGRAFGLDIGVTYGLAWCVLLGLLSEVTWCLAKLLNARRWARCLVVVAVLGGGTGVAPFEAWMWSDSANTAWDARMALWHNTRFIGLYDGQIDTQFGFDVIPTMSDMDLPLETIGYLTAQGDFHPPLGGFLLLLAALCLMVAWESSRASSKGNAGLLAATVPVSLALNAWVFPLHLLLVLSYLGSRAVRRYALHLPAVLAGIIVGFGLLYPHLSGMANQARSLSLHLVTLEAYTPFRHFLMLHWPLLTLIALGAFAAHAYRSLTWLLAAFFGLVIALGEFFYLGDSGGAYLRFNTTLKWWSWAQVGLIASVGACALASRRRVIRMAATLVLLAVSVQVIDLGRFYLYHEKPRFGRLQADGTLAYLPQYAEMMAFLRRQPAGIVLERPPEDRGAYTTHSLLALLSGHQTFLGWHDHLRNWGRSAPEITRRVEDIKQFYSGTLTNPAQWLLHNNINYVVWSEADSTAHPEAFRQLRVQLDAHYGWHIFRTQKEPAVGLWVRR